MKRFTCKFSSVEDIVAFVDRAEKCDYNIDVKYDHVLVDGKSIMGLVSLGIEKTVEIICYSDLAVAETLVPGAIAA